MTIKMLFSCIAYTLALHVTRSKGIRAVVLHILQKFVV